MICRFHRSGFAPFLVIATVFGAAWFAACGSSAPTPEPVPAVPPPATVVEVRATPLVLDPSDPSRTRVGELSIRSVLALESTHPDFGGFSGLAIEGTDRWLAVSDRGTWWAGRLVFDSEGALAGVDHVTTGALPDTDGRPVQGRYRHDAEELVAWSPESFLVSFEGSHRLQRFVREHGDGWRPATGLASVQLDLPPSLPTLPENGGIEAMARLPDGRLLIAAEEPDAEGRRRGWVADRNVQRPGGFVYTGPKGFRPTGAATLPNGDVVILERFYQPEVGVQARLLRIASTSLPVDASTADAPIDLATVDPVELGRFAKPLQVDNYEAVAVITAPATVPVPGNDPTRIFVLSDDNFSDTQQTLLMHAELP